ncbi:hypothetical protein BB559_006600 [Furculomyces boomerangus]|uniref:HAT C-terminal dimerisation domain-containing protein n=1 Tax=Furculomyces boomerangus TaxID=61424 RepID=A0A2T9Y1Q1_9FUNG|nr:hypothetical protein BB559_006600 [Furculomyces boomerangus]
MCNNNPIVSEPFFNSISDIVLSDNRLNSTSPIRSAAHTLQLAVYDTIKDAQIKSEKFKCQKICKKLRTNTILNIIKRMRHPRPKINFKTHWNSTDHLVIIGEHIIRNSLDNSSSYKNMTSSQVLESRFKGLLEIEKLILSKEMEFKKKSISKDFHELAKVILVVPATQVSVEKKFSAIKLILSDKRTNLSKKNLENILICRLNKF